MASSEEPSTVHRRVVEDPEMMRDSLAGINAVNSSASKKRVETATVKKVVKITR